MSSSEEDASEKSSIAIAASAEYPVSPSPPAILVSVELRTGQSPRRQETGGQSF